jgi:hypothetical protein
MRSPLPFRLLEIALVASLALSGRLTAAGEAIPHPEHPRPDFERKDWLNLNGPWLFRTDPKDEGLDAGWFKSPPAEGYRRITVPFPWESRLSGIGERYQGAAWYRRSFKVPEGWAGQRVFLVFGAADWEARVWVNGREVGSHEGGYLPFDCDITKALRKSGENDLAVRVVDRTDGETPTGKQTGWYTTTSGIWQTVYLEPRPAISLSGIRITPDLKRGGARFEVELRGPEAAAEAEVSVTFEDPQVVAISSRAVLKQGAGRAVLEGSIPRPVLWEPAHPHLYPCRVSVKAAGQPEDRVSTYFGMREVSQGPYQGSDRSYILLNGKPLYLMATLDQAFHPDGIYSYPSDEVARGDVEKNLEAGFNAIRLHIKVDDPRFYYWCDRLGCLVLYDLPSFARYTERSRANWEKTLRGAVARDFNHPSIIAWIDFNETWGIGDGGYGPEHQEWVASMTRLTRELDGSRLVEDNSPCNRDHVVTDLNSWHFYINNYEAARDHIANEVKRNFPGSGFNFTRGHQQGGEPLINSEYGGISSGDGDRDVSFCFKFLTDLLRGQERIVGYVYTELMDIEWEHNGIYNYDRSPKEFGYGDLSPGFTLRDLNSLDFVAIRNPPIIQTEPGAALELSLALSHFSNRDDRELTLTGRLDAIDEEGRAIGADLFRAPARWTRYGVVDQPKLEARLPAGRPFAGTITATLTNGAGERLAANFLNVVARSAPSPRVEMAGDRAVRLRFEPSEFSAAEPRPLRDRNRSLLRIPDQARVEYTLEAPEFVPLEAVEAVEIELEMAAAGSEKRSDWPGVKRRDEHPQTDGKKSPSTARITLAGGLARPAAGSSFELPDAPSDLRGFLSYGSGHPSGLYGYRVRAAREVNGLSSRTIRVAIECDPGSAGLALFGERMGRFPFDPTVSLKLNRPVHPPAGIAGLTAAREVPASALKPLLPTADERPVEWRYTIEEPKGPWTAPGFDDAGWKRGKSGFGTHGTPGAVIGTEWRGKDIWLRARFEAAGERGPFLLRVHHDEDAEVYLNGARVYAATGFLTDYEAVPLTPAGPLKKGENTMAVHCHQTSGGQYIDVGLQVETAAKAP